MKTLIVISCELPNPEAVTEVIKYLDPPQIPYFSGQVRVVVAQDVDDVIEFLDGPE